ncbi:MAG: phytanoyl-CoA dioxygenase family protein [Mucilaginibacter sp.]
MNYALTSHLENIRKDGFSVIDDFFSEDEVKNIILTIDQAHKSGDVFRQTNDLFAIRQCLKTIPALGKLILTDKFLSAVRDIFGDGYFVVKSIYFDKPEQSNWFVSWHQDLTISVDKKENLPDFGPWTVKQDQYAVQPPVNILKDNFTVRIHLDTTDEFNGALKVVAGSHLAGITRKENMDRRNAAETICKVKAGGIMIMRPLLFHASNRTTNGKRRRVLHIEFSRAELPTPLNWAEKELLL